MVPTCLKTMFLSVLILGRDARYRYPWGEVYILLSSLRTWSRNLLVCCFSNNANFPAKCKTCLYLTSHKVVIVSKHKVIFGENLPLPAREMGFLIACTSPHGGSSPAYHIRILCNWAVSELVAQVYIILIVKCQNILQKRESEHS